HSRPRPTHGGNSSERQGATAAPQETVAGTAPPHVPPFRAKAGTRSWRPGVIVEVKGAEPVARSGHIKPTQLPSASIANVEAVSIVVHRPALRTIAESGFSHCSADNPAGT